MPKKTVKKVYPVKFMPFNRAFTLIELLVVISIIGILSGFVFVSMNGAINLAKDVKRKADVETIQKAILIYSIQNNVYPGGSGTTPETSYPCTIGGGANPCTNLVASLEPYLKTVPTDSDGGYYVYAYSDTGTPSFTLQVPLSDSSVYQYSSISGVWTTLSGTQPTPTFSHSAGGIAFGTTVTISSANADAIYYTVDGSDPTTASTNQAVTPLVINSAVTVKALATRSGYSNSAIGTATYTQVIQATPTFSIAGGVIATGTTVTIISSGADAIYYTTNGTDPTTSSTNQAVTPLVINSDVTVKAIAVRSGYTNSNIGSIDYAACGGSVTFTYNGSSVTYGTVISQAGKCWMDRNLGASQAATLYNDAASYGDLFQWGRATDGHQIRTSTTTTTLSNSDTPGHSNFIKTSSNPYDWRSPQNNSLWQGSGGINSPCPTGWHIPTYSEWNAEVSAGSWSNRDSAFASPLKLPAAGYREYSTGTLSFVDSIACYWSSTINNPGTWAFTFSGSGYNVTMDVRARGYSIRCMK
jgi:uncharacterized protein (TIGR02145 family)/prepilin-type N-terminal cleavage/methylation domain-containing protein